MSETDLKARIQEDELRLEETGICSCYFSTGESNDHPFTAQGYCPFENRIKKKEHWVIIKP